MTITLTLDSVLRTILVIVAIAAIIVLIVLMAKILKSLRTLPDTMEHLEGILSDIETMSSTGRNAVNKASAALIGIKKAADENRGPIKAATSFVTALTGLIALTRENEKKKK